MTKCQINTLGVPPNLLWKHVSKSPTAFVGTPLFKTVKFPGPVTAKWVGFESWGDTRSPVVATGRPPARIVGHFVEIMKPPPVFGSPKFEIGLAMLVF